MNERGSKGGLARLDGRGSHGRERDHTERRFVPRERENTPEPRNPREILIVSSLG